MPTSWYHNIPHLLNLIHQVRPKSVLDVGPAYGKYGHLIREYLDDYQDGMKVDAVEIFPDYYARSTCKPYDQVTFGNFLDVEIHGHYDLVLMIDVLEHFTKDDAFKALDKARDLGQVLIATPRGFYEQGASHNNQNERHLSGWQPNELPGEDYSTNDTVIKLVQSKRKQD